MQTNSRARSASMQLQHHIFSHIFPHLQLTLVLTSMQPLLCLPYVAPAAAVILTGRYRIGSAVSVTKCCFYKVMSHPFDVKIVCLEAMQLGTTLHRMGMVLGLNTETKQFHVMCSA